MPLPYSYKTNIEVPDTENISRLEAINALADYIYGLNFNDFSINKGIIHFVANQAFINFRYQVDLHIEKDENIIVKYEIHLVQLIKITLALIVFSAFFSSFGFGGFLWFLFIFSFVFYFINLLFADTYIQKIIKKSPFYQAFDPMAHEGFSKEQLVWMKDKNRCPACGKELGDWDIYCPECGLRIKQNNFTIPLNVSKYKEKRFNYFYKEKKTPPQDKNQK